MGFIVEFQIASPVLEHSLQSDLSAVVKTEELRTTPTGSAKHLFWVKSDDLDRFEVGLREDPTIAEFTLLEDEGGRRLYRGTLTASGRQATTYPVATELDIVFLSIRIGSTWSTIRARVPTREALTTYRNACEDRDLAFRLKTIYREQDSFEDEAGQRYGVTDAQIEALLTALQMGYFQIPRQTTQEEIAEELGISTQAVSTRLRRGQSNLVDNLISPTPQ